MESRIEYTMEDLLLTAETVTERLKAFQYDSRYRLLGDSFLEDSQQWGRILRERKEEPLTVVVIGDFKRGKSSFINALLGEDIAPTNITPETMTLNRISYGAPRNEAILDGHRRIVLSDGELKKENLEKVAKETGEVIRKLELRRPCELLKQITVIDTPGMGDALRDFGETVRAAILQADVIVYVYNVLYPLSKSEQLFLKAAVLPQKYTKLYLVGNFMDLARTEEEYEKIRKMLRERTRGLLPEADVITVSALDERCRQRGVERPNTWAADLMAAEFERFRDSLSRLLTEKRETVVVDRVQRLVLAMADQLVMELRAMEQGLSMDRSGAAAMLSRLREKKEAEVADLTSKLEEIDRDVLAMRTEAQEWIEEFLKKIEKETDKLSSTSNEDLRKYYGFYCADLLQEALTVCMDYHQEVMYEKLEEFSEESAGRLASAFVSEKPIYIRMNLDNRIWTKGDTVGLVVSKIPFAGLLGTVLTLGVDAVTGVMRQTEAEQRKPELIGQIRIGFNELESAVAQTLEEMYAELAANAKEIIAQASDEEMAQAEHILEETLRVANEEESRKEEIRSVIKDAAALVEDCRRMVQV